MQRTCILFKRSGQSLIEYLLLTSLMAVGAMGVMRVMSHSVKGKFAQITESIQGKTPDVQFESVSKAVYDNSDMSNFMEGAAKGKKGKSKAKAGSSPVGPIEIEF